MSDPLAAVLAQLKGVKRQAKGYMAKCPAHEDRTPSLSVAVGSDGRVLLHCHAGCTTEAIAKALRLEVRDLFPATADAAEIWTPGGQAVAVYPYADEGGVVLFEVIRTADKQFRQRVPDPTAASGYRWKLDGTRRVLFHLPQLLAAVAAGKTVYIAEGEKDVMALERAGVAATCNSGGAGKWRPEYNAPLRGAVVVIVADKDEAGRAHAAKIAQSLQGIASSCVTVEAATGKDAADHLDAGRTVADFVAVRGADPERSPALSSPTDHIGGCDVVTLADLKAEPVRWLWPGRIPYGKLTVLEGDPGLGKSQLTLAVAAAVSMGRALPGAGLSNAGAGKPMDVLLLTGEDGLCDTVLPRLEAARGDPSRVHVLRGVPDPNHPGQFRFPSLPGDVTHLLSEIRKRSATLVIVDTLTTYLGGEFNSFKDADVRRALAPLANVAETTGCAILLVRHLTKQSRGRAITAGGGSIRIVGGARSCLLLAEDPDSPDVRVLAVVKANLAKKPDSLSLTIEGAANGWPHVVWGDTSSHSADDLIAARGEEGEDKAALDEARELLLTVLTDGPVLQQEVMRFAREAGISERTLRRAKKKEGIESRRQGYGKEPWYWQLPEHHTQPSGHLSDDSPVSSSVPASPIDGQAPWPSKAEDTLAISAERPSCSLHSGVPFRRRRHGSTGCWICMPPNPKNPYIEPLPGPGDAEYEKYRAVAA